MIWMRIAAKEEESGVRETPGAKHTPRILEYLATCTLLSRVLRLADETPWCSAFVNWCLLQAGYRVTRKATARSWLTYGEPLDHPQIGAIAVLTRKSLMPGSGHVGFVVGWDPHYVRLLGGNQGNRVSTRRYPRGRVIAYRWPVLA